MGTWAFSLSIDLWAVSRMTESSFENSSENGWKRFFFDAWGSITEWGIWLFFLEGLSVPRTLYLWPSSHWIRTWPKCMHRSDHWKRKGELRPPQPPYLPQNGNPCQQGITLTQSWGIRCRHTLGCKQDSLRHDTKSVYSLGKSKIIKICLTPSPTIVPLLLATSQEGDGHYWTEYELLADALTNSS